MNRLDKSIISYISNTTDFSDVDLRIEEHHGKKYLVAYVDVEKVDPNNPKYDPVYDEKLSERNLAKQRRAQAQGGFVIHNPNASLNRRLNDVKKFFGEDVNYEIAYLPKNYDYLDDLELVIRDAVKKINQDYDISFAWDSDYPSIKLTIYTGSKTNFDEIQKKYETSKNFMEYLDGKLNGKLKVSDYRWSISTGKKPKE